MCGQPLPKTYILFNVCGSPNQAQAAVLKIQWLESAEYLGFWNDCNFCCFRIEDTHETAMSLHNWSESTDDEVKAGNVRCPGQLLSYQLPQRERKS